jgi:hypothetical protein
LENLPSDGSTAVQKLLSDLFFKIINELIEPKPTFFREFTKGNKVDNIDNPCWDFGVVCHFKGEPQTNPFFSRSLVEYGFLVDFVFKKFNRDVGFVARFVHVD